VTSTPRILVADDQQDVLEALRLLLKSEGFTIETAGSPAAAWAALEGREFDVALIDLNYTRDTTSGREGMDLLARIRELDETLPVVVMTAWASVSLAVEAMRRTRGSSPFSAPRPSCRRPCATAAGWRARTARCEARPGSR
jgi:DNA-binding NtrC family response regulator